jgi:alkylhydroperoxidase family enzyme
VWPAVQEDWRTAPVGDRIRATLGFLEQLTLRPGEVTRSDAAAVMSTGVSEEALADAVHVAALFSMIVRLADSFGWHVPPARQLDARAPQMLESGYTLLTADTAARG